MRSVRSLSTAFISYWVNAGQGARTMEVSGYTVTIATPCDSDWNDMHGDDKRRFCHKCSLFVYDMTVMDENEKLDLIRMVQNKDRVCARIYTRKDGKVLTNDCPIGERVRRAYRTVNLAAWLLITGIFTSGLFVGLSWAKEALRVSLSQSFSTMTSQLTLGGMRAYPEQK